ncbi:MAG TPA: hypothetical protein VN612_10515 [Acidobacteriaceae bacterium]|nr:hypothetical protein [Acidobacteriaceae bacterium]
MDDLSPYLDLMQALKAARHPSCQLNLALRLVAVREDRGMYSQMIHGPLTADMRLLLAMSIVKEMRSE